jgi:hypothetical protein
LITQNISFDEPDLKKRWLVGVALAVALLMPATGYSQGGAAPARATNLSGYMDFQYRKPQFQDGELDFRRFVLLVTHQFSDRIRFVSELELEHAFVEGQVDAGELELEQAYLDFLLSRAFNVRAGILLIPVGILNERHEPPVYYGVERSMVDTFLVPTTWFEVGAGVHGEVGRGLRYRIYAVSPLNAALFTPEEGLREGRQKGSRTNAGRVAATGRLEYLGIRGLTTGVSFWTGKSGFEFRPTFDVPVHLIEADARYSRRGTEFRAQYVEVSVSNAGQLNDALTRRIGVDPNIGQRMRGALLEASHRFFSSPRLGEVGAFVRYDKANTQARMAAGAVPLGQFDRDAIVVGATYWPEPDIAVKVDYVIGRNRSTVLQAPNQFNVGLGWWF